MHNFFEKISTEVEQIESSLISKELEYDDINLWPILRVGFYMSRKKELSGYNNSSKRNKILNHINKYLVKIISSLKGDYQIQNKTTLYFGANTHRTRLDGKFLNRYFSHKITESSILVEYDNSLLFLDDNTIDVWRLIKWSRFKREVLKLKQDQRLLEKFAPFKPVFKNLYQDVLSYTVNVLAYNNLYKKVFEKSSIEEIYFLSYYSTPSFGACIAANHLNIKTIEVQHGPIGKFHLAYSPSKYFDFRDSKTIPAEIHLWHKNFKSAVGEMFNKNYVTGNYYLNQYSTVDKKTRTPSTILISLQPKDTEILELYDLVIKKLKNNYHIVIRLHPRLIKSKSLNNKLRFYEKIGVKISNPFFTPLHEDFENCVLHLTGYSGTTIEAFSMNIPSILYDQKAESFFEDFNDNKLIFFDFEKNREQNLNLIYSCLEKRNRI